MTTSKIHTSADDLRHLYWHCALTLAEMARWLGVSKTAVFAAMKRFNITCRAPGSGKGIWKSHDVLCLAKHRRVATMRGKPSKCEKCGTTDPLKIYVWHSPSKQYDDMFGYVRLCVRCHIHAEKIPRKHQGMKHSATSQFCGLSLSKGVKPWQATIHCGGKRYYLGTFATEIEAAKAYDKGALELYGPDARLNFPIKRGPK